MESPISACTSTTLDGGTPKRLDHLGLADRRLFFMVSYMIDAGLHELHQVLVGGDDGHLGAGFAAPARA